MAEVSRQHEAEALEQRGGGNSGESRDYVSLNAAHSNGAELGVTLYWVADRDLFARVRFVNRDLVWLNLLFLLPASLIPFAASVLGEYPDEARSTHIYGVVLILVTVMRLAVYAYAVQHPRLLWAKEVSDRPWIGYVLATAPILVYAIAMAAAPASTTASRLLFLAVPILYFLLITILRDGRAKRSEADNFS